MHRYIFVISWAKGWFSVDYHFWWFQSQIGFRISSVNIVTWKCVNFNKIECCVGLLVRSTTVKWKHQPNRRHKNEFNEESFSREKYCMRKEKRKKTPNIMVLIKCFFLSAKLSRVYQWRGHFFFFLGAGRRVYSRLHNEQSFMWNIHIFECFKNNSIIWWMANINAHLKIQLCSRAYGVILVNF